MSEFIDLTGRKFGRLTVLEHAGFYPGNGNALFLCECDCGEKRIVRSQYLLHGRSATETESSFGTQSCGCFRKEVSAQNRLTHGKSHSYNTDYDLDGQTYQSWLMLRRGHKAGGVSMPLDWFNDFMVYYRAIGKKPGADYRLYRKDCDAPHSKSNTHWVQLVPDTTDPNAKKVCKGCHKTKLLTDYYRNNNTRDKRMGLCKRCELKRRRER